VTRRLAGLDGVYREDQYQDVQEQAASDPEHKHDLSGKTDPKRASGPEVAGQNETEPADEDIGERVYDRVVEGSVP
jgi:hypothetical protein